MDLLQETIESHAKTLRAGIDSGREIGQRDAELRARPLVEALEELVAATVLVFPAYEEGRAAQEAWAERKGAALYKARAALAAYREGK